MNGLLNGLQNGRSVLYGLAGLIVCSLAAIVARRLVRRALERRKVNPDTLILIPRIVYLVLLGLGVVIFFGAAFSQPSFAFNSVLIATLIAGFGLQDLVKNYVSGFYILFEGNVKVGDVIKTDPYIGEVTDVRIRVTYLRGEDGSLIVVPNNELFNKTVQIQRPVPRPRGRVVRRARPE